MEWRTINVPANCSLFSVLSGRPMVKRSDFVLQNVKFVAWLFWGIEFSFWFKNPELNCTIDISCALEHLLIKFLEWKFVWDYLVLV